MNLEDQEKNLDHLYLKFLKPTSQPLIRNSLTAN